MSSVNQKVFSHTHYGVSTIAAVLYGVAWLIGNQVRAEVGSDVQVESTTLPAIVVTAPRVLEASAMMDPVVVTARREAVVKYATLAPVVVTGSRNVYASAGVTAQPSAKVVQTSLPVAEINGGQSSSNKPKLTAKARTWLRNWIVGARF